MLFSRALKTLPELLEGCLQNDRKCQELLYKQFYGYAMGVCMRYVPNREEALEVVNDGFLKIFQKVQKYDAEKSFKIWLRRVMINTALDHYRQNVKYQNHTDLSVAENTIATPDGDNAYNTLAHEDLIELIQQLTPSYRTVFNLYVIDGFSHEEISRQLGISEGTSKSNLARARENLRVMLSKKKSNEYARVSR
ncbi:RNA polymerase sigma factor [Runella slithyformis]|uniref:RNA polymerase, sigma-24 subunit, ECF subfamily n=1 Tax=Runella slithyformis (strain ATCC 29530 / DSM 19594 / LMG 11500 / NCIMB 11436 / LSU 4) TaxID=761193 RepID=A0A7U3ZR52_RUNSL|nr:sigma-70 family RNA polymerase sigma factor [Runella slithyformis]AEI51837.1 RNA polymerase, sigma-24 subunit, ECF subfamily [Runella slithyformis DSM 19594]